MELIYYSISCYGDMKVDCYTVFLYEVVRQKLCSFLNFLLKFPRDSRFVKTLRVEDR